MKFKELSVPAALIVEEGAEDDTRVIRTEARHRFLQKSGIKVFARPEHLKVWLESKGKKLADYQHLIVDAGRCVPGFTLESPRRRILHAFTICTENRGGDVGSQRQLSCHTSDHS